MSVAAMMLAMELGDQAGRENDVELESLAAVTQVGAALELDLAAPSLGGEFAARTLFQPNVFPANPLQ